MLSRRTSHSSLVTPYPSLLTPHPLIWHESVPPEDALRFVGHDELKVLRRGRALAPGEHCGGIDDRGMAVGGKRPYDAHSPVRDGVRAIDDAERCFTAGHEVQRCSHVLRPCDAIGYGRPYPKRLQGRFPVLACRHVV